MAIIREDDRIILTEENAVKFNKMINDKEIETELRGLMDSIDTSSQIPNNKYTYEITNTITEKSICGRTKITTKCIEDGIIVEIEIANYNRNRRDYIKEKLNKEHSKLLKDNKDNKWAIDVGDIL